MTVMHATKLSCDFILYNVLCMAAYLPKVIRCSFTLTYCCAAQFEKHGNRYLASALFNIFIFTFFQAKPGPKLASK